MEGSISPYRLTLKSLRSIFPKIPLEVLLAVWKQKKVKLFTFGGLFSVTFALWKVGSLRAKYNTSNIQPNGQKVEVDKTFVRRLFTLIKICIPSIRSWEFLQLIILSILLLSRTFLTITIATLMGNNVSFLVEGEFYKFVNGVTKIGLVAIPASAVNSALKYVSSVFAIFCRRRLTFHAHSHYLSPVSFYPTSTSFPPPPSLSSSLPAISNCDQRITQDIEKFAVCISSIFSSFFKPLLDVVLFTKTLSSSVGMGGPIVMFIYYISTGLFLRSIMPSFAKLCSEQQLLENQFRFGHSRLIHHSEEISFYSAHDREKQIISTLFSNVFSKSISIFRLQAFINVLDGWLIKYGATLVGYVIVAIPVFCSTHKDEVMDKKLFSKRAGDFIRNTQLLINLATSLGQLVLLHKKTLSLAATTTQVAELFEQFDSQKKIHSSGPHNLPKFLGKEEMEDITEDYSHPEFCKGTTVSFENVSIISPDGRTLVEDLNFEIKPGQNLLIVGANGCGKTSIFRVLAGIWPLHCGRITIPAGKDIIYLPQRAYCPIGTLRDQLIYPYSHKQMLEEGHTDDDLSQLLDYVNLSYLLKRPGSMDAIANWESVLARSEQQRLAIVRVFFHKPRYAIFDEATNAVNTELESLIYQHCKEIGITLISVSHKPTLKFHHNNLLTINGDGSWNLSDIN